MTGNRIENTPGISPAEPSPSVSAGETESAGKNEPSAFDRVMDRQPSADEKSGQEKQPGAKEGTGKDRRRLEAEWALRDPAHFHHLRQLTMEAPSPADTMKVDKAATARLVDEVVSAVRTGLNRAGDREIQLDLKSNVLDGLSLRLSFHENRLVAVLEASTFDVKQQLEARAGDLLKALELRGIKDAQLQVQFKETGGQPPPPYRDPDRDQSRRQSQSGEEPDDETPR